MTLNVHAHRRAPTHLFRGNADPRASVWGVLILIEAPDPGGVGG